MFELIHRCTYSIVLIYCHKVFGRKGEKLLVVLGRTVSWPLYSIIILISLLLLLLFGFEVTYCWGNPFSSAQKMLLVVLRDHEEQGIKPTHPTCKAYIQFSELVASWPNSMNYMTWLWSGLTSGSWLRDHSWQYLPGFNLVKCLSRTQLHHFEMLRKVGSVQGLLPALCWVTPYFT